MATDLPDGVAAGKGFLHVRAHKGKPFYEARWRDLKRAQRRHRLGAAWVELDSTGEWVPRRGRVRRGYLDERRAYPLMAAVIEAHETKLRLGEPSRPQALFPEAVDAWLVYLETEKRVKPSTLAGYRHIHRQILHAMFEFARREDSFGLPSNPFAGTTKRPEDGAKPIETFEPDEIRAIARAARAGLHRGKGGYAHSNYSARTEREWRRINEQDAALFTIAACTGLRLGEVVALRWSDVDLEGGVLIVSRSISAGQETSTKSRRARTVPLAEQAIAEFERQRARDHFRGREDFVFCRPDGDPLDGSSVRYRFNRAQEKAQVRVRRFHDLRHTFGSLAIRRFDLVAVKEMMGHSALTTTERYLHSKPRPSDAAKLTAIFNGHEEGEELALAA